MLSKLTLEIEGSKPLTLMGATTNSSEKEFKIVLGTRRHQESHKITEEMQSVWLKSIDAKIWAIKSYLFNQELLFNDKSTHGIDIIIVIFVL